MVKVSTCKNKEKKQNPILDSLKETKINQE